MMMMIRSRQWISVGWNKDWPNGCRTIFLPSKSTTARMNRHLTMHQQRIIASRLAGEMASENTKFDWTKKTARNVPNKRESCISTGPKLQFGRVRSGKRQSTGLNDRIAKHGKKHRWVPILQIFQHNKDNFDMLSLTTTISSLAHAPTFNPEGDTNIPEITERIANWIDQLGYVDFGQYTVICHSIARLRVNDDGSQRIFNHLLNPDFARDIVFGGSPQATSKMFWNLDKLERPDLTKSLLHQLNDAYLKSLLQMAKVDQVSHIARACGMVGESWPTLFNAIEERADWVLQHGDPKAISNIAWACARLDVSSPVLFTAINSRGKWLVSKGNCFAIANTAWACAKLGHVSPDLFHAMLKRWFWLMKKCKKHEVATIKWAFETLGHPIPTKG